VVKLLTFDLWETIIIDEGEGESARDRLRAEFIIKTLGLLPGIKQDILSFFDELVAAFKNPVQENDWSILPETQLDYLFRKLSVNVNKGEFESIYKYYTEVILDFQPALTEPIVPDVLKELKKSYLIGLISNTGRTPGRVLLTLLERLKIKEYFDFYVFSDEILMRKPDPRVFQIALNKAQVLPEETVHIGDSYRMDYVGAKNVQINAILYAPGALLPQGEPFVRSFQEIPEALKKLW